MGHRFLQADSADASSPWRVEQRGLEPVPVNQRSATVTDVMWLWMAANIGVFTFGVGAQLAQLGLAVWQVVIVAIGGAVGSFAFVALIGLAGPAAGTPTLLASRATFGVRGNLGPIAVAWLVLVGFEVAMSTTAAFTVAEVAQSLGLPAVGLPFTVPLVIVLVAGAAVIAYFGHATILWIQKWLGWALAAFTVIVCVIALTTVDWSAAMAAPAGSFAAMMAGIAIVATIGGVNWLAVGADYTRYLPEDTPKLKLAGFTVLGASAPLVILTTSGSILTLGNVMAFGGSASAVGLALPDWLLVPYLVVAFLGMFTAADLAMYSSGLTLQTAGVPLSRPKVSLINAGVVAVVSAIIVAIRTTGDPLGADVFSALVGVLLIPLVAWVGVFGLDLLLHRNLLSKDLNLTGEDSEYWFHRGFHWPAVSAWLFGIVAGLLCARVQVGDQEWFVGPLANTWIGWNSLGWWVAGIGAAAAYWVLEPLVDHRSIPGRVQLDD